MSELDGDRSSAGLRHWLLFRKFAARAAELESLLAELPAVRGAWPEPEPGRLLILVGCDSGYLSEHGLPFACSLDRNSPGTHLHIHLINPDAASERTLERLERELTRTTLSRTAERFDFTELSQEFARAYCASVRFVRLLQLLRAVGTGILLLDVDVLVRGGLEELRDIRNSYDCAIHTRFHSRREREKVFASAFYAAPTPAALAYLERVATHIATAIVQRKAKWYVDQLALYEAYRSCRASGPAVRLRHLSACYADWTFRKNSTIWAGKGRRKEADEIYLAERAAYTPKAAQLAAAAPLITVARPRVAVLLPRLDLPFKNPGGLRGLPDRLRRRSPHDMRLRAYWRTLAEAIGAAFQRRGCEAALIVHPLWQMTTEFVDRLEADVVFIPHKQRFHFGHLRCRTYFYMQVIFPWLFTVDPLGWSAGSSAYPCDHRAGDSESGTFERYIERIVGQNESKYEQRARINRRELVARGEIPDGPYIFFACQRPTDQAVRFYSPYEAIDVAAGVARWAKKRGFSVVFKAHPTNIARARPLHDATSGYDVYWSMASVHDLIAHSDAVYVINSGVGFEAMLHNKPVVTFGQVEYDAVSIHGDIAALDRTWQAVQGSDPAQRLAAYRRFVDWYCRLYCVDLSDPQTGNARLAALVEKAVSTVQTESQSEPAEPEKISVRL
ncbi:MAG: hypothetical protein ACE5H8_06780 [Alphaproteobacteria bacterium]